MYGDVEFVMTGDQGGDGMLNTAVSSQNLLGVFDTIIGNTGADL